MALELSLYYSPRLRPSLDELVSARQVFMHKPAPPQDLPCMSLAPAPRVPVSLTFVLLQCPACVTAPHQHISPFRPPCRLLPLTAFRHPPLPAAPCRTITTPIPLFPRQSRRQLAHTSFHPPARRSGSPTRCPATARRTRRLCRSTARFFRSHSSSTSRRRHRRSSSSSRRHRRQQRLTRNRNPRSALSIPRIFSSSSISIHSSISSSRSQPRVAASRRARAPSPTARATTSPAS